MTTFSSSPPAGGAGDNRGWDGWMAPPTQWTWVWVSSRNWWWTGRPGVLPSMGSQRVWHDWATELNYYHSTPPLERPAWISGGNKKDEAKNIKSEIQSIWDWDHEDKMQTQERKGLLKWLIWQEVILVSFEFLSLYLDIWPNSFLLYIQTWKTWD